ncbi:MAG TPA: hypothetical protein PLN21_21290 [Gemmatales bacterium]|nr:hypothetical protein [Gemmatales bacterium]
MPRSQETSSHDKPNQPAHRTEAAGAGTLGGRGFILFFLVVLFHFEFGELAKVLIPSGWVAGLNVLRSRLLLL